MLDKKDITKKLLRGDICKGCIHLEKQEYGFYFSGFNVRCSYPKIKDYIKDACLCNYKYYAKSIEESIIDEVKQRNSNLDTDGLLREAVEEELK